MLEIATQRNKIYRDLELDETQHCRVLTRMISREIQSDYGTATILSQH